MIELQRISCNAFAVKRLADGVEIRRLRMPSPAPAGRTAKVVVFPWARGRPRR